MLLIFGKLEILCVLKILMKILLYATAIINFIFSLVTDIDNQTQQFLQNQRFTIQSFKLHN